VTSNRPNYRNAPLKGATREMILELCRRLVAFGSLRELTYVGMGGLDFSDFVVAYQKLGTERMFSIEAGESVSRLSFNRPYDFIEIIPGQTNDVLRDIEDIEDRRCVVWLDYQSRLTANERQDIEYLASSLAPGSAFFVTVNAYTSVNMSQPAAAQEIAIEKEMGRLRRDLGDHFDEARGWKDYLKDGLGDVQREAGVRTVARTMLGRPGQRADLVMDVRYRDFAQMQVLGWVVSDQQVDIADICHLSDLEYTWQARDGVPLSLRWPDITTREWEHLSREALSSPPSSLPHAEIDLPTLAAFQALYRYRPLGASSHR
jgi:hypothetical protein